MFLHKGVEKFPNGFQSWVTEHTNVRQNEASVIQAKARLNGAKKRKLELQNQIKEIEVISSLWLRASHLYKRVCPTVRPSVGPSGRRSVTPFLRRVLGASYAEYLALFKS